MQRRQLPIVSTEPQGAENRCFYRRGDKCTLAPMAKEIAQRLHGRLDLGEDAQRGLELAEQYAQPGGITGEKGGFCIANDRNDCNASVRE